MNKSAKIIYSVIALLILAAPISASADNQGFSFEKGGFLTAWNSNVKQNPNPSLYERLRSAIENFTSSLISQSDQENANAKQETVSLSVKTKRKIIATAYSSTPDQTDSSPFITANGSFVRQGVVAANFLKFGTKVRIPEVYGDKIFVVEDRMAKKNSHKIDIWMESRAQALEFGVKYLTVEILES